jgi:hypothetical protein
MSEDRPCDTTVFELGDADFSSEGTVGLVEDVLRCYFKTFAEMFTREEEVKSWWGDDDLCSRNVSIYILFEQAFLSGVR